MIPDPKVIIEQLENKPVDEMSEMEFRRYVMAHVPQIRGTHDHLTKVIDDNTVVTQRTSETVNTIAEILEAANGAFKVLGWIGRAAKPIGYIAGAFAACVGAWQAARAMGTGWFKW